MSKSVKNASFARARWRLHKRNDASIHRRLEEMFKTSGKRLPYVEGLEVNSKNPLPTEMFKASKGHNSANVNMGGNNYMGGKKFKKLPLQDILKRADSTQYSAGIRATLNELNRLNINNIVKTTLRNVRDKHTVPPHESLYHFAERTVRKNPPRKEVSISKTSGLITPLSLLTQKQLLELLEKAGKDPRRLIKPEQYDMGIHVTQHKLNRLQVNSNVKNTLREVRLYHKVPADESLHNFARRMAIASSRPHAASRNMRQSGTSIIWISKGHNGTVSPGTQSEMRTKPPKQLTKALGAPNINRTANGRLAYTYRIPTNHMSNNEISALITAIQSRYGDPSLRKNWTSNGWKTDGGQYSFTFNAIR